MHPHVREGAAPHAAWVTVPTDEQAESPTGRKAPFVISPVGLSRSGQLSKRGHGFASSAQ